MVLSVVWVQGCGKGRHDVIYLLVRAGDFFQCVSILIMYFVQWENLSSELLVWVFLDLLFNDLMFKFVQCLLNRWHRPFWLMALTLLGRFLQNLLCMC